jgi:hypothetical protein
MSDSDLEAIKHYEEAADREPAPGPTQRRRERAVIQHVPVRFPASTVDVVRELAERDGMSVSAWIRRTVEREAARRATPELQAEMRADARAVVKRLLRISPISPR